MAAQFFSRGLAIFNNITARGGITIGTGAQVKAFRHGTLSVVHGTVLPQRLGTVSTALSGLGANDVLIANLSGAQTITNGLALGGVAPKAGTVDVFLSNGTAGTVAPGTFNLPYIHVDMT